MLNAERVETAPPYWDGDLRHLTMRTWCEESGVAAMIVARDGQARGWFNIRHVHAGNAWLVWLRLRHDALTRPFAILDAADLAGLTISGDQQAGSA